MNAKHLFLTLTMLLASITFAWAGYVYDEISFDVVKANESFPGIVEYVDAETYCEVYNMGVFGTASEYSAAFYYDKTNEKLGFIYDVAFSAVASAGYARKVTITWDPSTTSGKQIAVYYSNTPFSGLEDAATLIGTSLKNATYTGASTTDVDIPSDFQFVAFLTTSDNVWIKSIDVQWEEIIPLVPHNVKHGSLTSPFAWGTDVTIDRAEDEDLYEGDIVTITFTPKKIGKVLLSYSYDDMEFDVSCMGYVARGEKYVAKFPMPGDRDVTVSATFGTDPRAEAPTVLIDGGISSVVLQSGVNLVVPFTVSPTVEGTPTFEITDLTKGSVVDYTYDGSAGTVTLHGLATTSGASPTLTVKSPRNATHKVGSSSITFTVTPRDAVLLAEYDGSYYAMQNTISGLGRAAGLSGVYAAGGVYYYDVNEFASIDNITWHISEPAEDTYAIQNPNNSEKYVYVGTGKLKEDASSSTWLKDAEADQFVDDNTYSIVFTGSNFVARKGFEGAAFEAVIDQTFLPMTYSTVSDAGIIDARTLAAGDWGTLCVPFNVSSTSVSASGATFYELTGKHVEGDVLVGVYISDPMTELVAGHSYIYQINGGSSSIVLTGSTAMVNTAVVNGTDGFVGCLPGNGASITVPAGMPNGDNTDKPNGCYGLSKGKLRYVTSTSTGTIRAYRAYIDASELTEPAPAPGRRMLMNVDYDGDFDPSVMTSIIDVNDVLYIDWSKPVYNIMGIQVGKGATGVLIQNGQKFLVQ